MRVGSGCHPPGEREEKVRDGQIADALAAPSPAEREKVSREGATDEGRAATQISV